MIVQFTIQDTPKGIYPVLKWAGNGTTDHPASSLSMHLIAHLVKHIEELDKKGMLKIDKPN